MTSILETERLVLRRWVDADRAPFAAINSDPLVMATLGPALTREQSDAFVDRIEALFEHNGFGLWCVDVKDGPSSIGYVGLHPVPAQLPSTPAIEIGWRLASSTWGRGYAPEAAAEVLRDAFERVGLADIVSFTAVTNTKSRRVMEKIGLAHRQRHDFDHPALAFDDPLRPHVLYGITRQEWQTRRP